MKSNTALILVLCLAATASGCRKASPEGEMRPLRTEAHLAEQGGIVIRPDSAMLSQLEIEPVSTAELPVDEVSAPGRIEFDVSRVSRVLLPVPGRIERVHVRLGDAVAAGQPILTIDSPDADAAVSEFRQARASITQARSTLTKATADHERTADLFEHKAAAKKEVLAAENELALAEAALKQADAAGEQARRRLEILGLGEGDAGSRVTLGASLSGKVIELSVTTGEYRNATDTPVMTIADLSTVWVTSEIPETSIRLIEVGERVQVELIAFPGEVFEARVTRIADTLDPRTRTVQVRAELANPAGRLKPEMFGRILHSHAARAVPVVPARAILRSGSEISVFIERRPGMFERIPVDIGTPTGGRVPVLTGIKPGDRVVVGGVMLLAGIEGR